MRLSGPPMCSARAVAALPPRLGAILALSVFLTLGAGARDANAAIVIEKTQNFGFSFDAPLGGGGYLDGSGVLTAQQPLLSVSNVWTGVQANGELSYAPSSSVLPSIYSLSLAPPGTFNNNDNTLYYPPTPNYVDTQGITFDVFQGNTLVGYLNIHDPQGSYTINLVDPNLNPIAGGSGNFQATPGPTPGTGLLALAFLMLAGVAARARGLLAR